jgi:hypothetical protein
MVGSAQPGAILSPEMNVMAWAQSAEAILGVTAAQFFMLNLDGRRKLVKSSLDNCRWDCDLTRKVGERFCSYTVTYARRIAPTSPI